MTQSRIAILSNVEDGIRRLPPDIKRGVREALRAISLDPGRGEALRLDLQDYMKYRVRRFRIVYSVDRRARRVTVVAVGHRRTVYEELAAMMRAGSGTDR